jgi:sugar-specific transcriptional regulator TrmB
MGVVKVIFLYFLAYQFCMDLASLKEIGLTDGEVRVYLSLLKLGSTKTGRLASSARVSSSKVYKILARLEQKGLVSHVLRDGVTYFSALSPKHLLQYLDDESEKINEKKKVVEGLMPSLEEYIQKTDKTQATVYTGFKAVSNIFRGILEELKEGDEYFVIGARYVSELPEQMRFFAKYHQLRALKGIKVNMLANNEIRGTLVPWSKKVSDVRFLPDYLISNIQILFYKNKSFVIVWTADPVAFLIESNEVSKSFKKYFNAFWKIAKK